MIRKISFLTFATTFCLLVCQTVANAQFVNVFQSDDVLFIQGSEQDDRVIVKKVGSNTLRVKANGVNHNFVSATVGLIIFNGDYGDDVFKYYASGFEVEASGDEGDDKLVTTNGPVSFDGGPGEDRLFGGPQADYLIGGADDDIIHGGGKGDWIAGDFPEFDNQGPPPTEFEGGDGEYGNDLIYGGSGPDLICGGFGNDMMYGNGGDDQIDSFGGFNVYYGGAGSDTLLGGNDDDVMHGGTGSDLISARNGNDYASGGTGADVLCGDDGEDTLDGNSGDDELYGGNDFDQLNGGTGDDFESQDGQGPGCQGDGDDGDNGNNES